MLVDTWRSTFRGLLADAFLDGMSREDQAVRHARRMGVPGVCYLVAVEPATGEIIGFANFGPARGKVPDDIHEIYALYVRANIRGAGSARRLSQRRQRTARSKGQSRCLPGCWPAIPTGNSTSGWAQKRSRQRRIGLGDRSYEQVAYLWDDIDACS